MSQNQTPWTISWVEHKLIAFEMKREEWDESKRGWNALCRPPTKQDTDQQSFWKKNDEEQKDRKGTHTNE